MNYNLDILEPTKPNDSPLKINEEQLQGLLHNFCYVKTNNEIIINYENFRAINAFVGNKFVLQYLIFVIENVLNKFETFIVHAKIKKLTLLEIDKNKDFIFEMSNILKIKFNDKLETCVIYDGSFIFKQMCNILSTFIDKNTMAKIQFYKE
jgi:hypothetical protein